MLKKILLTISLITTIFIVESFAKTVNLNMENNSAKTSTVEAYKIDPSYRPENIPFSLKEEMNPTTGTILVLQIIAGALLYFAFPIGVIMIAWGAFTMVTSGTDQEKIEQSKKHLLWSVLGLLAIILSYSIVRIILTFIIQSSST